jgi:hypothetical protein
MKLLEDFGKWLANVAADAENQTFEEYIDSSADQHEAAYDAHMRQRERSDFLNDVANATQGDK